jgi:Mg-chelatase subunit ChlD
MNSIIRGSVADVAKRNNQSIATTFLSVDCVVLCDTSGSMGARDSVGGNSRYDQACKELATLQGSLPGKIGVISFSDQVMFCPNGEPFYFGGGTDLAAALKYAKIADVPGGMRFIVISDGEPSDERAALKVAHSYHNRIDVIFCGDERFPTGREFLERLAKASGGQSVTADRVSQLAASVTKLLATA